MSLKCAFFDIDGTLIDSTKGIFRIRQPHLEMLQRLQQMGIKVVSATGRQLNSLKSVADFSFDANICLNGSMVFVSDKLISHRTIEDETVVELWGFLNNHHVGFVMQGESVYYCIDKNNQHVTDYARQVSKNKENQVFYSYPNKPIYKVSIFLEDIYQKERIINFLQDDYNLMFYNSHLRSDNEERLNGEITRKDVHKGNGVVTVLDYLKIRPEDAVAFGDNSNDVEMFKVVKGFAMQESTEDLREHCFKVIGDVTSMTIIEEIEDMIKHY
jgi:Cof subfamily protein (haloacid dehalogenase superfamily)